MKKAFITTVFNEEKTIKKLLESLKNQNEIPSETIIVDAFSDDKTVKIIKEYQEEYPSLHIVLLQKKGNRSEGRNLAIKNTKSDIIAVSDSGCVLKKDWFYEITKPFNEKSVDVVAGFYKPITHSVFEKSLSTYTCVMEENVTDSFLPSSRSVAFKKIVWRKEKGYPEDLDTCEDLFFARKLKRKGYKFFVNKKAVVYWPQRKNLFQAFHQFFSYAKGDGMALYVRWQTPLLYLRVIASVILFLMFLNTRSIVVLLMIVMLFFLYVVWSIIKNYRYVKNRMAIFYLPLLQITSDVAVFFGMTFGFFGRLFPF